MLHRQICKLIEICFIDILYESWSLAPGYSEALDDVTVNNKVTAHALFATSNHKLPFNKSIEMSLCTEHILARAPADSMHSHINVESFQVVCCGTPCQRCLSCSTHNTSSPQSCSEGFPHSMWVCWLVAKGACSVLHSLTCLPAGSMCGILFQSGWVTGYSHHHCQGQIACLNVRTQSEQRPNTLILTDLQTWHKLITNSTQRRYKSLQMIYKHIIKMMQNDTRDLRLQYKFAANLLQIQCN